MEMQYFKEYSPALGREMECKVYGHGGRPMLYIPCQDGRFFDFEDFHMADTLAPVSYTHLRAHETDSYLVCRLLLEKKKKTQQHTRTMFR